MTKEELTNKIVTFTGGRAAEALIFKSITTGASNDIEQATRIARAMITRYGMSDEFGMVALESQTNTYLGGDSSLVCAPDTSSLIDQKVIELVNASYEKAYRLLEQNKMKLHELAKFLYERETITGDEFMEILFRKEALPYAEAVYQDAADDNKIIDAASVTIRDCDPAAAGHDNEVDQAPSADDANTSI